MEWTIIIIAIIGIGFAYIAGCLNGINHGLDNLKVLGSIKIAYNQDGERYMALEVGPGKLTEMDDDSVLYGIFKIERFEEKR